MAKPSPSSSQPKISQKLILRTAIFLFLLAALFFGFRYLQDKHGDFNSGSSNTAGDIAALQQTSDGDKLVLVHPDGSLTSTKSWAQGNTDRDIVWEPDGRFLYFTSDRDAETFHIYRWNPDDPDAEVRTSDKRARSSITFPADAPEDADSEILNVSGGNVQAFDPKTRITPQILPPPSATATVSADEESGGSEALFQSLYGRLGTSFRYARFCKGGRYIAAIMEREGGEVLILQSTTMKDGKLPRPIPVAGGDHVEFDVNPKDGSIVYEAQNFRFPDPDEIPKQFIKNNKVVYPFRHVLGAVDPDKGPQTPIGASLDDQKGGAFANPAISPDGASVLVAVGPYDAATGQMKSKMLVSVPIQPIGIQSSSRIVEGEATEPTWSPDGSTIGFVMRADGHQDVYTISKTGGDQKNLTNGKGGDYSHPKFSPMLPQGQSGGQSG